MFVCVCVEKVVVLRTDSKFSTHFGSQHAKTQWLGGAEVVRVVIAFIIAMATLAITAIGGECRSTGANLGADVFRTEPDVVNERHDETSATHTISWGGGVTIARIAYGAK